MCMYICVSLSLYIYIYIYIYTYMYIISLANNQADISLAPNFWGLGA